MKKIFFALTIAQVILFVCSAPAPHTKAYSATAPNGIWELVSSPTTQDIRSLSMISATDGWAVAAGGDIIHWDGTRWNKVPSPTINRLYDISMISSTDGWAVGLGGTVLRWNGSLWSQVTVPQATYNDFYGVDAHSSSDVWIVGRGSNVLHFNGTNISVVPFSACSEDVSMLSASDGWIVGCSGSINRWNGSTWSAQVSPTTYHLNSVHMLSANDGWAAGGITTGWKGKIFHWDGNFWSESPITNALWIYDVWAVSPTDVWAVGHMYGVFHYDGVSWSFINIAPEFRTEGLNGIEMVSANEGWIVGDKGTIVHYYVPPQISVNHSSGVPGSFFKFTGTGFPANSQASISVNGISLG